MNEDLLDHIELVNWIHYMSYSSARVNKETINIEGRPFLELPSGKRVIITIKIEEWKE